MQNDQHANSLGDVKLQLHHHLAQLADTLLDPECQKSLKLDSVRLQQVQHPAVEFRVAVQMVSRPSDHFQVQNRLFRRLSGAAGSQPDHRFSRNSPSGRSSRRLPSANLKSCVIKRRPRQVPHLWIFVRTVRQCSAAGGRLSLQVGQIGFACSRVVLLARWRLPQKPIACFFCAVR